MKLSPLISRSQPGSRKGSILICVLVSLAVSTALVTTMVRSALVARRAGRMQLQVRQTEQLLAAGVQRAARQLEVDNEYAGETWDVSGAAVPGAASSQVIIKIDAAEGDTSPEVYVTAQLSIGSAQIVQRSYHFSIDPQRSSE